MDSRMVVLSEYWKLLLALSFCFVRVVDLFSRIFCLRPEATYVSFVIL